MSDEKPRAVNLRRIFTILRDIGGVIYVHLTQIKMILNYSNNTEMMTIETERGNLPE